MITFPQDAAGKTGAHNAFGSALGAQYYALVHWLRGVGTMSAAVPRSIGVTGCARGEGVSTVASNLALVAAQVSDQPVLLIDLSALRPATAPRFGMAGDLGLRAALADVSRSSEYAKATGVANLWLLAANGPDDPRALGADCRRVNDLLRSLEQAFGFIVVDLPTVESNLCFAAAGALSGVLLVTEAERTSHAAAARARQRLVLANANVLGAILNKHHQYVPKWLAKRL